jgi:hypothetical protein
MLTGTVIPTTHQFACMYVYAQAGHYHYAESHKARSVCLLIWKKSHLALNLRSTTI